MKNYIKLFLSCCITASFLFIAFGSSDDESSTSSSSNSSSNSNTEKVEESKCRRCGGSGVVATYSSLGCHCDGIIYHGDCEPHQHKSSCVSSGSKTCPCCNGTGK